MSTGPAMAMGRPGRWLMIVAIIAVVATVVAALFVMDPPARERAERLDRIRLDHLQVLSQRIDLHVEMEGALPAQLAEVMSGPGGAMADPVSGEPYGYAPTGDRSYTLCATFDAALDPMEAGMRDEWRHPAGPHCFERKVQPVTRPALPARAAPAPGSGGQ